MALVQATRIAIASTARISGDPEQVRVLVRAGTLDSKHAGRRVA